MIQFLSSQQARPKRGRGIQPQRGSPHLLMFQVTKVRSGDPTIFVQLFDSKVVKIADLKAHIASQCETL